MSQNETVLSQHEIIFIVVPTRGTMLIAARIATTPRKKIAQCKVRSQQKTRLSGDKRARQDASRTGD